MQAVLFICLVGQCSYRIVEFGLLLSSSRHDVTAAFWSAQHSECFAGNGRHSARHVSTQADITRYINGEWLAQMLSLGHYV